MYLFFFFNDTATTEIYTLSLHDALPICAASPALAQTVTLKLATIVGNDNPFTTSAIKFKEVARSEEHTSELQSRLHLVCRLLLEKKKNKEMMERNWLRVVCKATDQQVYL